MVVTRLHFRLTFSPRLILHHRGALRVRLPVTRVKGPDWLPPVRASRAYDPSANGRFFDRSPLGVDQMFREANVTAETTEDYRKRRRANNSMSAFDELLAPECEV